MKFIDLTNEQLFNLGVDNQKQYLNAKPFPNIWFDDFFKIDKIKEILQEFPSLGSEKKDIHYANANEIKYATKGEARFGETTKEFMHFMNSQPFLEFLQNLTGIKETLIPDPYFEGGGCHQIKSGGFLKLHVDFHKHRQMNLDRRVNVLVYLNENWDDAWRGSFELWEKDMSKVVTKISPTINRVAIFSTTDTSWHGHPDTLLCPEDRSRKSLALYYYTNGRPSSEVSAENQQRVTTTFSARKGQDSSKMLLFNGFVNFMNDILPPFIVRLIKKFRNK